MCFFFFFFEKCPFCLVAIESFSNFPAMFNSLYFNFKRYTTFILSLYLFIYSLPLVPIILKN